MPFCKTCGTFYPKSMGICPKCNANELLEQQADAAPPPLTPEAEHALKKRRWITIIVGLPMLIGLIYGIYYVVRQLQS